MTVLDKTINNIPRTTLAHTHTHTQKPRAELSFMSRDSEDKEGVVHYIIRAKALHLISPSITHWQPRGEGEREGETKCGKSVMRKDRR